MDEVEDEDEDARIEDSGVGSASERNVSEDRDEPTLSVLERAKRLQGEIDKREEERTNRRSWDRRGGSVDSLLDWESDSTRPPSLPPKVNTSALSSNPPLPPKGSGVNDITSPPPLPPKSRSVDKQGVVPTDSGLHGSSESLHSSEVPSSAMEGYIEDGYIIEDGFILQDGFNMKDGYSMQDGYSLQDGYMVQDGYLVEDEYVNNESPRTDDDYILQYESGDNSDTEVEEIHDQEDTHDDYADDDDDDDDDEYENEKDKNYAYSIQVIEVIVISFLIISRILVNKIDLLDYITPLPLS